MAETHLVAKAECDRILEGEEFESLSSDRLEQLFVEQEPVGVGGKGEGRDSRDQIGEDPFAPTVRL